MIIIIIMIIIISVVQEITAWERIVISTEKSSSACIADSLPTRETAEIPETAATALMHPPWPILPKMQTLPS
jgi:hypothetical protein